MGFNVEQEDQIFKQEVEAVKQWWKVSRHSIPLCYLSYSLDRVLSTLLPISPSILYPPSPLLSYSFSLHSPSLLSLSITDIPLSSLSLYPFYYPASLHRSPYLYLSSSPVSSFRQNQASIHCRASGLKERYHPTTIPFKRSR